jgi:hypothetical protein
MSRIVIGVPTFRLVIVKITDLYLQEVTLSFIGSALPCSVLL